MLDFAKSLRKMEELEYVIQLEKKFPKEPQKELKVQGEQKKEGKREAKSLKSDYSCSCFL